MGDEYDSKYYARLPIFSGKKKDFEQWKRSMKTFIGSAGLSDALVRGDEVERDDHVWPDDEDQEEAVKEGKRLQSVNRKAAGALYQAMKQSTEEGKMALSVIAPHYEV